MDAIFAGAESWELVCCWCNLLGVQRWRQPTIIARSTERRISMLNRMESVEVRLKCVRTNGIWNVV